MLTAVRYPATEEICNKIKTSQILCTLCLNWNPDEVPVLYSVTVSVKPVSKFSFLSPFKHKMQKGTRSSVLNCLDLSVFMVRFLQMLSGVGAGQIQVTLLVFAGSRAEGYFMGFWDLVPQVLQGKASVLSFSCSVPTGSNSLRVLRA